MSGILYHNGECLSSILIKSHYAVLSIPSLSSKGILKIVLSELIESKNKETNIFFCGKCMLEVPFTDIVVQCMYCGNFFKPDEVFLSKSDESYSFYYCNNCITKLNLLKGKSVESIIK